MPSRRVLTNGWFFWLAHHQKHGLILFDRADQDDVPAGSLRVFEARKSSRFILPQEELKSETSDDVSDSEFVQIVNLYNGVKVSLGKPIKAPRYGDNSSLEERHKQFLRERGLPDNVMRSATGNRSHRVTHCWSCKSHLDNSVDVECVSCMWIICVCGACGCGR